MSEAQRPGEDVICETVRMAREILPENVALQVPPNLVDPLPPIEAGADDLGGLSSITPDWINPERPWPDIGDLQMRLSGYCLRERLPIYPRYIHRAWQGARTAQLVRDLAGEDGLRRK
jgi:FO synthase subunit 1